jgi:hypothetical protein
MSDIKCSICRDSGWVWRHELPNTDDWDGSIDDTQYDCPYCNCEREESSKCKHERLKKEAELAEKNRVELLESDLAVMLRDGVTWADNALDRIDYLNDRLYSTIKAVQSRHLDLLK